MGDIKGEPKSLLRSRIQHKIAEFNYNLTRMALRKEEINHELNIINENESATKEAVKSQEQQLKELGL
jgi:hypothetical protein